MKGISSEEEIEITVNKPLQKIKTMPQIKEQPLGVLWEKSKLKDYLDKHKKIKCCFCIIFFIILFYFIVIIIGIIILVTGDEYQMTVPESMPVHTMSLLLERKYDYSYVEYNDSIPMRKFEYKTADLVDHSLMNITADACTDFYEYSCGNFNKIYFDKQNEMLRIVSNHNVEKKTRINIDIINKRNGLCMINTNQEGCLTAMKYFEKCVYDKHHSVMPDKVIEKLNVGLGNTSTTFSRIRFLIENGITNFVHLTKENDPKEGWTHYLRPGGVLFPDTSIHLGLYGEEGLKNNQKEFITVGEFITEMGNKNWIRIFGKHAKEEDLLFIENLQYFKNLNRLLEQLPRKEIINRLKWYIRNSLRFFWGYNCLEQTKLLFPITFCRLFMRLSRLEDHENGVDIAKNVFNQIKTFSNEEDINVSLRIGTCSALLHSNNIGNSLIKVENQEGIVLELEGMTVIEWAQKYLFKKWYKFYDPVYLFMTYPRILDNYIKDPLEWYAQTNAFFDHFHNEIVVPPGMIQYPIYHEKYEPAGQYSRIGFIFGHEISHSIQHLKDLSCIDNSHEKFADIYGLSNTLEFYNANFSDSDPCAFLLSFAQIFCSQDPDYMYGEHGTHRERVNFPINFGSRVLIRQFNKCFGCEKKANKKKCLF